MASTTSVVFSRDRAMQLDATLRSFFSCCDDPEEVGVFVLYRTSSGRYERQYRQLSIEYGTRYGVKFVRERDFRTDLLSLLFEGEIVNGWRSFLTFIVGSRNRWWQRPRPRSFPGRHVLFLVDDNVFVRRFRIGDAVRALSAHHDALGFSLRLGVNTVYCYSRDATQRLPSFQASSEEIVTFDWTSAEQDFGYPLEVSSSLYRLGDLAPVLSRLSFDNPNTLEGLMADEAAGFKRTLPRLLQYRQSVTFCNPVNMVQTVNANRAGRLPIYGSARLADLFEQGHRVDVRTYRGFVPNACHQEVELVFTPPVHEH